MKKFWIICAAGVLVVGLGAAAVQAAAADAGKSLSHCAAWQTNPNCIKDCQNDNTGVCPADCDGSHAGVCTGGQYYQDSNGDGICDNAGSCPQNCDGSHDGACTGGQNQGNHQGHCGGGHHGGHT